MKSGHIIVVIHITASHNCPPPSIPLQSPAPPVVAVRLRLMAAGEALSFAAGWETMVEMSGGGTGIGVAFFFLFSHR